MFLVNSRLGSFAAIPPPRNLRYAIMKQALSRSYGRYFAEFLNEGYLVRLSIFYLPTCVGLKYEYYMLSSRGFS